MHHEARSILEPTNFLFLMSDEHTRRMTGCYGHPIVKTPNIDQLSEVGVRFDNAYINCPICVPSRATFLTGRYVHQTGHWDNGHPYVGNEAASWGHRLQENGLSLTSIGKLHYRDDADDNGISEKRVSMNVKDGIGDVWGSIRWKQDAKDWMIQNVLDAGPGDSQYIRFDTAVADDAVDWITNVAPGKSEPWATLVSFVTPHFPFTVPQEYFDMYPPETVDLPIKWREQDRSSHPYWDIVRPWLFPADGDLDESTVRRCISAYYGLVTFMDHQIGRVLDALEKSGQADRTRIIYSSDHGEMLGGHGLWGKMCMYEDSAAVPFIMAGPDIPKGSVCSSNVSWVDIFPTALDCVGVPLDKDDEDLPGVSLLPLARGESDPDRIIFSEYHAAFSATANFMIKDDRYKLVYFVGDQYPGELYDLIEDPTELNDLGQDPQFSDTRNRLERELRKICDPESINEKAFAAQRAHVERHGGESAVRSAGMKINFTPAPKSFH